MQSHTLMLFVDRRQCFSDATMTTTIEHDMGHQTSAKKWGEKELSCNGREAVHAVSWDTCARQHVMKTPHLSPTAMWLFATPRVTKTG